MPGNDEKNIFRPALTMALHRSARWLGVAALLLAPMVLQPAAAVIIEANFSGLVKQIGNPSAGSFALDDVVTGTLHFDTTTSPETGIVQSTGTRARYAALIDFDITVGSYTATATGGAVDVSDDVEQGTIPRDAVTFNAEFNHSTGAGLLGTVLSGPAVAGAPLSRMQLSLSTLASNGVLASADLPDVATLNSLVAVNESDRNTNFISFFGGPSTVRFDLTSVQFRSSQGNLSNQIGSVPAPGTFGLVLLAGFAAVAGRRRGRSST